MENFGLGLVLNFQDNATSKIDSVIGMMENLQKSINEVANSASGSIQHISGMSNALLALGAGITTLGGAGVATFTSLTKNIVGMSSQFERNITALTQMYGNAQVAQEKFLAYERMAASTPLGMEVIQSAATRLKTVGVEAEKTFNVLVDGTKTSRALLEILGDLSVMRPDKTMEDVIREGIEFIEGNARPIKMSFGLDVDSKNSINEKLADTAEGRLDQLVRMIEKAGYTGALDKTNETWDTIMQNLGDNFKVLSFYVGIIGGIFEDVKAPFKELFKYLNKLLDQKGVMANIGKSIANGLKIVIAPAMAVLRLVNKLIISFVEFTKEHPKIVSMGIAFVGLASQITLVAGVGLVALGVFLKLRVMVIRLIAGLRTFVATTRLASMSFGMLLRSILPVTIAMGFLYYAWRTNFLGLRTIVGGTLQYIANLFDIVADAMTHIDIEKGIFSLTKKHHNLAEQMGIMPLLKGLATAYNYAIMFGRGMKEGFANAQQVISDINTKIDNFLQSLSGTPLEGFANDIKRVKEDFTTMFNPQTANDIQYIGKVFGELAVYAGILVGAFTLLKPVFTVVSTIFSVMSSAVGIVVSIVTKIGSAIVFIGQAVTAISALFGVVISAPAWLVGAITVAVVALIATIYAYRDEIATFFSELWSSLTTWFSEAYDTVATFFSELWSSLTTWASEAYNTVATFFSGIIESVSAYASEIWGSFTEAISPVTETISYVGEYIVTFGELVYQTIRLAFWSAYNVVAKFASDAVTAIGGFIGGIATLFNMFSNFVAGIFLGIAGYIWGNFISPAIAAFVSFYSMASEVFNSILEVVWRIFNDAVTAVNGFINGAMQLVDMGINAIIQFFIMCYEEIMANFINPLIEAFTPVYNTAVSIFGQVESFISGVFDNIQSVASRVLEWIQQKISDILDGIGDIASKLPSLPSLDELKERVGLVKEAADKEANADNNALGGIYSKPLLTWVAEAGYPEAIVPLDGSARGVALWEQAGRMLGALPNSLTSAEKVTAPIPTTAPVRTVPIPVPVSAPQPAQSPSDGGITFEAGSIQFNVTTDNFDADKAAQMIMPIIQRKLEIMRMTSRQGGALA